MFPEGLSRRRSRVRVSSLPPYNSLISQGSLNKRASLFSFMGVIQGPQRAPRKKEGSSGKCVRDNPGHEGHPEITRQKVLDGTLTSGTGTLTKAAMISPFVSLLCRSEYARTWRSLRETMAQFSLFRRASLPFNSNRNTESSGF